MAGTGQKGKNWAEFTFSYTHTRTRVPTRSAFYLPPAHRTGLCAHACLLPWFTTYVTPATHTSLHLPTWTHTTTTTTHTTAASSSPHPLPTTIFISSIFTLPYVRFYLPTGVPPHHYHTLLYHTPFPALYCTPHTCRTTYCTPAFCTKHFITHLPIICSTTTTTTLGPFCHSTHTEFSHTVPHHSYPHLRACRKLRHTVHHHHTSTTTCLHTWWTRSPYHLPHYTYLLLCTTTFLHTCAASSRSVPFTCYIHHLPAHVLLRLLFRSTHLCRFLLYCCSFTTVFATTTYLCTHALQDKFCLHTTLHCVHTLPGMRTLRFCACRTPHCAAFACLLRFTDAYTLYYLPFTYAPFSHLPPVPHHTCLPRTTHTLRWDRCTTIHIRSLGFCRLSFLLRIRSFLSYCLLLFHTLSTYLFYCFVLPSILTMLLISCILRLQYLYHRSSPHLLFPVTILPIFLLPGSCYTPPATPAVSRFSS